VEWTESGIAGAARFVQRLYRIAESIAAASPPNLDYEAALRTPSAEARKRRELTHRTIAAVTEALQNFTFNIAVARIYELTGALAGPTPEEPQLRAARYEAMLTIALLVSPMMPHLAEEIFSKLKPNAGLAAEQPWPIARQEFLEVTELTIGIQVNGKIRGTITIHKDQPHEQVLAIAKQAAAGALLGQTIVKEIYVPGRIVNFVAKP
jgi:leucyl-tRNA synthetase